MPRTIERQVAVKNVGILIGGAMLIASINGAVAQHAAQGQPPPSEAPQRTTATYGDWVVQCVTEAQQAHQKICDMAQSTQVQGRNLPFSRVAIAHPVKGRAAAGAGKLSFADAGGHEVSVPLSFNGFNQAFDALLKE
jgi:invasion protein IalB